MKKKKIIITNNMPINVFISIQLISFHFFFLDFLAFHY